MGLQEQISLCNNPQEFAKLCNTIFSAIYKTDYLVVDGTRSDEGNDGYVHSEQSLLAIYCPMKPEKETDAKYKKKIITDLDKAKKLSGNGRYEIKYWIFVTPRKLSNDVLAYLLSEAKNRGFEGRHIEATFLSNKLYEYPHLIREFPGLQVGELEQKLDEVIQQLETTPQLPPRDQTLPQESEADSVDFKQAQELYEAGFTDSNKTSLKTLYYKTTDKWAWLQCMLSFLNWYEPIKDTLREQLQYCEEAFSVASQLNAHREKIVVLSYKGLRLSEQFCEEDSNSVFQVRANEIAGLIFSEREEVIAKIRALGEAANDAFRQADELARRLADPEVLGQVYLNIGNAASLKFMHFKGFGLTERATLEKTLARKAFELAKQVYALSGNKTGIACALRNLANHLRFEGEFTEALALTDECIKIGNDYGVSDLIQKGMMLKNRIHEMMKPCQQY